MKALTSARYVSLAVLGWALLCTGLADAATFTLQWDPNTEPDLAGYKLHYGTSSGTYTTHIDVGNVTTYDVAGLQDGVTYYFAVTARDTEGNESGYSNEVSGRKNLAPQASASATPTSGHAPLSVSFTGSGTDPDGTIASFSWTFGDGGTSSAQSPSHTYSAPGTYTATLTVTDNDGATGTKSVQITVSAPNQPPMITASATPARGAPPLTVTFTGSATDSDGTVVSLSWDFGDGGTSPGPDATHSYDAEGTYTAVLTATDDDGATSTKSFVITVNAAPSRPKGLKIGKIK